MTDIVIRGVEDPRIIDGLRAMLVEHTIETFVDGSKVEDPQDHWTVSHIRTLYAGLRVERQRALVRGLGKHYGYLNANVVRSANGKLSGLTGSITKTYNRLVDNGELPAGLPQLVRPVTEGGSCYAFESHPAATRSIVAAFKDWPKES